MSRLVLYGIVDAAPPALCTGAAGEPLRCIGDGGLRAVVGEVAPPPSPTPTALRAHDAAVRRLAASVDALLPARYGETAEEADLVSVLRARAAAFEAALSEVRGCVQMTVRVYGDGAPAGSAGGDSSTGDGAAVPSVPADADAEASATSSDAGPGRRWLLARAAAARVPELDALRAHLGPWIVRERATRHDGAPLLASAFHLIRRDAVDGYRAALEDAPSPHRLTCTGPWPPYAFAKASP